MMDALITGFVEELKLKLNSNATTIPVVSTTTIERAASLFDGSVTADGKYGHNCTI